MVVSIYNGNLFQDPFIFSSMTTFLCDSSSSIFWEIILQILLYYSNINATIPPAKIGDTLSTGFSISTSVLLLRTYFPHHIDICQALPSLSLSFLTRMLSRTTQPKITFPFKHTTLNLNYYSNIFSSFQLDLSHLTN